MRDKNRYHRRQTTNIQSAHDTGIATTTNKEYITSRYNNNSDDDDNESYPSVGKNIIVTCNKKRNMPPRDRRGEIDYGQDRGIDYDKQRKTRDTSRDDYKQYKKNSYQREPSGTVSKSYHREPSGMRISQLMDEERQPQNNNRDDYPYNRTARDEYRDNAQTTRRDGINKEEINDDSWEISSRITSISNARSSSFPNNHSEGIPKSIPTKIIRTNKSSKGGIVDCNASRMTGWTGHTGVTPLVNNLEMSTKKKKQQYGQGRVENDREDQCRQEEEDKVLRTRSTNNKPPRPSVARSPSPILPTLTKTHDEGHSNYNRESSNTGGGGSSNNTSNSSIKKMLTNVSSITGWSPDKHQNKLAKDDQEQQDVGIDPARGSFDLVIIPKEKRRRQKKQVIKKQLTAVEAASVASETVHHKPQQHVMKNLTYWSSLSVKAAMAVISSDTKRSDEEKMAQIAANAVLEAGREYDLTVNSGSIKRGRKEEKKVDLKDVATKVSVAILEAGGDHTVATAVAVAIMNERAPQKDQGSDSSVSTEVAVNTSDGVQGSTENINEALSSSITTKDTTTGSIFSRNRWNNRKSKSATDDSIRAAAARGVRKADQGRNDSEWQGQVDRRNSGLDGGLDRQSVTASMASKRRELEAKEAEIISRNQALEAAALLNQQKEAEIQQRLQELNTTNQKQQQLKDQEDEIKLKNEQLEAAARMNEQMEFEIKQRMLALDEATNALLVRAENVQNEINTRVTAPNNGQQQQAAVSSLGRVDVGQEFVEGGYQQRQQQQQQQYDPRQGNEYNESRGNVYDPYNSNVYHQPPREGLSNGHNEPQRDTKADGEISVYTNQADYGQQSRFDLIQQQEHQEQKQQRHERSQSDPSRLQQQTDKGILEQISDKLYSIIDDANLCDTSCADPSTLRPGENSVTRRRPSYHNMDPASSFGSSLPMNKPTISGLTTQEDQHRTWSNWFGKSNNMPKSQQESSHLPPVHAAVNQALNQPQKMQQTNPSQQLPEYKSPSEMVDLNQALVQAMNQRDHTHNTQPTDKALDKALKQAMGQAPGIEFQPISHNIQQESSMLSGNSNKVGGLGTKLKSRFKKQKNTATAQPQEGSKKRFFSLARRKAK